MSPFGAEETGGGGEVEAVARCCDHRRLSRRRGKHVSEQSSARAASGRRGEVV
ncbi:hypothetical protein [Kutzneria buriramensis]|uniref:hypothetical protein n=1 Tax=Kutzneria buriramensis TaxID=1045776 RepID=UPI001476ACFE|nr:hypothetical protein [Kutzneria buriramensis]